MRKKLLSVAATLACCFFITPFLANAIEYPPTPPGLGTVESPYLIDSLEDLLWLSEGNGGLSDTARWSSHYRQTSNIDATATSGWNSGLGFSPVGEGTTPFTGSYAGDGYAITGLFINRPATDGVGFFGICKGAALTDISLVDVDITGNENVGGLVGEFNGGTISFSSITGASVVTGGKGKLGGLVGLTHQLFSGPVEISDSHSSALVSAPAPAALSVGGLIGFSNGFKITVTRCYATGDVVADGIYLGGLVGEAELTDFRECYATGRVENLSDIWGDTGGFAGNAQGCTIERCYATGDVSVGGELNTKVGGFAGTFSGSVTSDCFASGNVVGGRGVGGFGGRNESSSGLITRCYSTGSSSGEARSTYGFLGYDGADTTASFWDTETSLNADTSGAAVGKTTAEMMTEQTFTDAGWDFNEVWTIDEGVGYPQLVWTISKTDDGGSESGGCFLQAIRLMQ